MCYQHLIQHQRHQIATLDGAGVSSRHIADVVQCHYITIARELLRNRATGTYQGNLAHKQATARRHAARSRTQIEASTWVLIGKQLREQWSPAQISGREIVRVSHEHIYAYIAADR